MTRTDKKPINDVPHIFGMPTIIQKCDINETKGNISASLREIHRNAYECHKQHVDENRNTLPSHYNFLEFACNSDMCIMLNSKNYKFKIGFVLCNESSLCHDVEGYDSIKEALVDTAKWVGLVHQIAHSAVSWVEGEIIDNDKPLGCTSYRLHFHHLTQLNISGVILPDRSKLDSCLGMDQVIISPIENERCNKSYIDDIVACWANICNKFFIDEGIN